MDSPAASKLRVGYVPEHFSTPLHFAQTRGFFSSRSLDVTLLPYPSGTGAMTKSLEAGDLDLAIGLTEGWVAALANGSSAFKLVGEYVSTPLCWAISTGADRNDMVDSSSLAPATDPEGNRARKLLGISRYGSGSYVMGFVLAEQNGWLDEHGADEPFDWAVLNDFKNLRDGVNGVHKDGKRADAFMWEHFTSKKYYDTAEIRRIGETYTPWPSWHIVAHSDLASSVSGIATTGAFLKAVDEGIKHFNTHRDEAAEYISTHLDYSEDDARAWLKTVAFSADCRKVERDVVEKTVAILKKAGVVKGDAAGGEVTAEGMVLDLGYRGARGH